MPLVIRLCLCYVNKINFVVLRVKNRLRCTTVKCQGTLTKLTEA